MKRKIIREHISNCLKRGPIALVCPFCFQHLAHTSIELAKTWLDICDRYAHNNGSLIIYDNSEVTESLQKLEELNFIITTDAFSEESSKELDIKVFGYSYRSDSEREFCLTPDICN